VIETPDFGVFCDEILGEPITNAWAEFFRCVEGLPVLNEEFVNARMGRDHYTPRIYPEATGCMGRRSEKTRSGLKFLIWRALYANYESQLPRSWFKKLGRHTERLRIPIIATDMKVAKDIQRVAESLVLGSPVVSREVAEILADEIVFKNGVSILCRPASRASVRGFACPAALVDELAWISLDGADEKELLRQLRPAAIQFGQARRILKMSTPWQKSGVLYSEYCERASRPDLLFWQASTSMMTHRISEEELERERVSDPVYFQREFLAEFTSDLETFLPWPDVHAAVQAWTELPPAFGPSYTAALDASGLSGGDTFSFAIGHRAEAAFVVDLMHGWKRQAVPFVMDEIANLAKSYGVASILADQYSFPFVAELMCGRGVRMEQLAFSARTKTELHFDLKNLLAQKKMELPNHPEMIRELNSLESTRTSGGAYRIAAPRGMHDDFVTVLAILANKAKRSSKKLFIPEILEIRPNQLPPPPEPTPFVDPREGIDVYDPRVDLPRERWTKIN
jgi:hypothetical protein